MTNHKGKWCPYKNGVICQEGYCSDCNLYPHSKASHGGLVIAGLIGLIALVLYKSFDDQA